TAWLTGWTADGATLASLLHEAVTLTSRTIAEVGVDRNGDRIASREARGAEESWIAAGDVTDVLIIEDNVTTVGSVCARPALASRIGVKSPAALAHVVVTGLSERGPGNDERYDECDTFHDACPFLRVNLRAP